MAEDNCSTPPEASAANVKACNRSEAERARNLAEDRFKSGDVEGAKRLVLLAQRMCPDLPGLHPMIVAYDVHLAAAAAAGGGQDGGMRRWYQVLDVGPSADYQEVKSQFKKLCLLIHPDKNQSAAANGAFQLVNEAWEALSGHLKSGSQSSSRTPQSRSYKSRPSFSSGYMQFANKSGSGATPSDARSYGAGDLPPTGRPTSGTIGETGRTKVHGHGTNTYNARTNPNTSTNPSASSLHDSGIHQSQRMNQNSRLNTSNDTGIHPSQRMNQNSLLNTSNDSGIHHSQRMNQNSRLNTSKDRVYDACGGTNPIDSPKEPISIKNSSGKGFSVPSEDTSNYAKKDDACGDNTIDDRPNASERSGSTSNISQRDNPGGNSTSNAVMNRGFGASNPRTGDVQGSRSPRQVSHNSSCNASNAQKDYCSTPRMNSSSGTNEARQYDCVSGKERLQCSITSNTSNGRRSDNHNAKDKVDSDSKYHKRCFYNSKRCTIM